MVMSGTWPSHAAMCVRWMKQMMKRVNRNGGKKVLDFGKKFKIEKKIDPSIWRETYDLRER